MASTQEEEQAFIDGTHPALMGVSARHERNSPSPPRSRSVSPTPSNSSSTTPSPRFTAADPGGDNAPPPSVNAPARNGGASNTGPKGVIADWKARNNGGAGGVVNNTGPKGVLADYRGSMDAERSMAVLSIENGKLKPTFVSLKGQVDDDDDVRGHLEDDKAAIEAYRRQRLQELSGSGVRGPGEGRKTFGHLREIGFDQFLGAVEEEDKDVAVVLHLYESDIAACLVLNHHLSSIARAFPNTKFIRALASELDFAANSEDETLPTLLVYRGGDLETTIVRADLEWGGGSEREVLELLSRHSAISGDAILPFNMPAHRETRSHRGAALDDDSGDSD